MICEKCKFMGRGERQMEMRKSFGRDHHWHCELCNHTVIVADRLAPTDRENFKHDEL